MIHLTVAVPLGLDSLYFSFIQLLATQNGHPCVDSPAEYIDGDEEVEWIDTMRRSSNHHFVVGYRYPPHNWKSLLSNSASVALLADGDGIIRQVEQIFRSEYEQGDSRERKQIIEGIYPGVHALLEMVEILLKEVSPTQVLIPAYAFLRDPQIAFKRIENFYQAAGVPITISCWEEFSMEAKPLISRIDLPPAEAEKEVIRYLTLAISNKSKLEALETLFSQRSF